MHTSRYEELFRENMVMTIDNLKLETGQPRESILRDLKRIGYYSSYNERGKFYTLGSMPEFDDFGLWKYRNAYFSIRRTLLDTAEYLVNASNAGCTHDELRRMLSIGIQNSLYQLTIANKITRQRIGDQYIYFGKEKYDEQLERRNAMHVEPLIRKAVKHPNTRDYPDMEPLVVIDILIAILRGHETNSEVYRYLHQIGSPITTQQIVEVFRHYDIGKKNSASQK